MGDVTAWAVITWLKVTGLSLAVVGAAWVFLTVGWFWLVVALVGWVWCFLTRQVGREWARELNFTWWGAR